MMKISMHDSSAILPLREALPRNVQDKTESLYNYIENSILYPLRMVEDTEEADAEFEELYPKYERIRATINTMLLDSLGDKGYEKVERGIQSELGNLSTGEFLSNRKKANMIESFEKAKKINDLLFEAALNTEELGEKGENIDDLPESRQKDFQELIEYIGKWELALTVASIAVIAKQGEGEVINHYIDRGWEFIEKANEKATELVKNCVYCEKPFFIKRTNQKYCSKSCLNKARNKRYREG